MTQSGKKKVLFVCTNNSARSQMAEGFLKSLGAGRFEVYSAGTLPFGVDPMAVHVMKEAGVDISKQTSDLLTDELISGVDLLVTLCGDARDNCPVVPDSVEKDHWPVEDPVGTADTHEEIAKRFIKTRDDIRTHIQKLIDS